MNGDEMLELWRKERNRHEVSRGFSDAVMNRILEYAGKRDKGTFSLDRLIEVITSNPAATAALVALGAAAGITRAAIVVLSFLAF